MRHSLVVAAVLCTLTGPAIAAPTAYDIAFVSEFAEACVPGRLTYEGTKAAVLKAGWSEVTADAHPELSAMMAISEREAKAPDLTDPTFDYALYSKPIEGSPHYMVVSRASAIIGEPDDPLNPWAYVGCYLYNFEAAAPIDPEPVTALIGNPISNSQIDMHINAWLWGPPCPMPRTGDTYLTFIPEVSQYKEQTGFSGLVLKFDTSELDPGAAVPDPYC